MCALHLFSPLICHLLHLSSSFVLGTDDGTADTAMNQTDTSRGRWDCSAAAAAKSLQSCLTVWPHRQQPTRLPCPWDFPGKNTGVGCHFLLQCIKVKSEREVAQSCPTLRDPVDCSLPGSSIHGISRQEYWSGVPLPSLEIALGEQNFLPQNVPLSHED